MITPQAIIAVLQINIMRRPLVHPETAQDCLNLTRRELMALVESGGLPWCFNIARKGASDLEPRLLTLSVWERQSGPVPGIGDSRSMTLEQVMDLILPKTRESLRGRELQQTFACHPDTVSTLAKDREIVKIKESLPLVGPNSSPRFTRSSVAGFLTRRRVA